MAKNANLHKAKDAKVDEFYTRREDIEAELSHYRSHFKDQIVYCNCDDPTWSEFWQFFVRVFKDWGLKKLIATHYEPDEKNYAYKLEICEDTNGDGRIDTNDEPTITQIQCNGDFRNQICIDLLKESTLICTNPPFSMIREYILQLIEYNKKFLIIGPLNAVKYKDTFPLIKEGKMWMGYTHPKMFRVPDTAAGASVVEINGVKYQKFGNVQWYTNLDIPKIHTFLDLRGNYYRKKDYPPYYNYDAIDVEKVNDIPCDYDGKMGVPISFLENFNPEQFEIIGLSHAKGLLEGTREIGEKWIADYRAIGKTGHLTANCHDMVGYVNGKPKAYYPRVIIRNKNPEPRRYPDED